MKFTQKQYLNEIKRIEKHAAQIAKKIGYGTNVYKNCSDAMARIKSAFVDEYPDYIKDSDEYRTFMKRLGPPIDKQ